jgi:hypothetical protein
VTLWKDSATGRGRGRASAPSGAVTREGKMFSGGSGRTHVVEAAA